MKKLLIKPTFKQINVTSRLSQKTFPLLRCSLIGWLEIPNDGDTRLFPEAWSFFPIIKK